MTSASPASDLAPESTSPSRQVLIALGLTGTTGCPASRRASTRRPSGRSIPTGMVSGSPRRASRRIRPARPAAECSTVNAATRRPAASWTQTAWMAEAQSIPTKNTAPTTLSDNTSPQLGSDVTRRAGLAAGWSLTGALRRFSLLPVCSPGKDQEWRCHAGPRRATAPSHLPAPAEFQQRLSQKAPSEGWCPSDRAAAGARPGARVAPVRADAREPGSPGGHRRRGGPVAAGRRAGAGRRDELLVGGHPRLPASGAGPGGTRPGGPDEPRDVRRADPRAGGAPGRPPGRADRAGPRVPLRLRLGQRRGRDQDVPAVLALARPTGQAPLAHLAGWLSRGHLPGDERVRPGGRDAPALARDPARAGVRPRTTGHVRSGLRGGADRGVRAAPRRARRGARGAGGTGSRRDAVPRSGLPARAAGAVRPVPDIVSFR